MVDLTAMLLRCTLYRGHRCAELHRHHIVPKSWFEHAGKPVDTPMAWLCPNCHTDVHCALDRLIEGREIGFIPRRARRLARQALALAQEKGLTPSRTL